MTTVLTVPERNKFLAFCKEQAKHCRKRIEELEALKRKGAPHTPFIISNCIIEEYAFNKLAKILILTDKYYIVGG